MSTDDIRTLSIVVIGDEILLGRVTDTNSGTISRALGARGWETRGVRAVGDNASDIRAAIGAAMAEADLVITTGGLGPTRDDITKGVLMGIFGGKLVMDPSVTENIERVFAGRGLTLNELTRQQALVPDSCRVIQNTFGTAPVMWFEKGGKVLVAMPGVPFETRGMIEGAVADAVEAHFHPHGRFRRAEMTATGITESALAERLADYEDSLPAGTHLAYLPSPGIIVLRLDSAGTDAAAFETLADRLRTLLGDNYSGEGAMSAAAIVLEALRRRSMTLGAAESCTGGRVAAAVTAVAGCSDVFHGSIVAYANSAKRNLLGVSAESLASEGAVSETVVRQMAEGARRALGTDCAVATSGIAGPDGGTPQKPVGTVWIAAATPAGTCAQLLHLRGDREAIASGAAARALMLLMKQLTL